MYCEKAQKECHYLDVVRVVDESRVVAGILRADIDPVGEIDNVFVETIRSFERQANEICEGEESCGAIKAAIVTSIINSAVSKADLTD